MSRRKVNVGVQKVLLKMQGRLERYRDGWRGDLGEPVNDLMQVCFVLVDAMLVQEQRIRELEVATGKRDHA
jgi:hypothetical protein